MIFDTRKNIDCYKGISAHLDAAIEYIKTADFAAAPAGKTQVCDSFYFNKFAGETRPMAEDGFEAHRQYIDIFLLCSGREMVTVGDVDTLTPVCDYSPAEDYIGLTGAAAATAVNTPETFVILFPQDAHNSGYGVDDEIIAYDKVVMKVKV